MFSKNTSTVLFFSKLMETVVGTLALQETFLVAYIVSPSRILRPATISQSLSVWNVIFT